MTMDRFWSKVKIEGSDDCWPWLAATASRTPNYTVGKFFLNGKNRSVPRIAYELSKGPIPQGHIVRHRCDNPLCCNPSHLETGTHQENSDDTKSRCRRYMGFTDKEIGFVRLMKLAGMSNNDLAKILGKRSSMVWGVMNIPHRYAHVALPVVISGWSRL